MQGDPYDKRPPYAAPLYMQGGAAPPPYLARASTLDMVVGVVEIVLGAIGVLCGAWLTVVGTLIMANRTAGAGGIGGLLSLGALGAGLLIALTHVLMIVAGVGIVRFRKFGFILAGIVGVVLAAFFARGLFVGHLAAVSSSRPGYSAGYMAGRVVLPILLFAAHGLIAIYSFARVRAAI